MPRKTLHQDYYNPSEIFTVFFTAIHKNIWSKLSEIVVNRVLDGIIAIRLLFEKLFKKIKKWDSLHNAGYIYIAETQPIHSMKLYQKVED